MPENEIKEILEKLRYHVSLLGQTIDHDAFPVESLVISMDWQREELNKAHDIFEKWDHRLENGESMIAADFEQEFSDHLGISYQGLKSIIIAFYRNGQWTNVCEAYVDSFGTSPAMEYHSIMRRQRH